MFVQKFVVSNDFIDLNGHLSEVGYYYYAVQTVWAINKKLGLVKKYEEFRIGPIIFDTEIKFMKEVFHGERINVSISFSNIIQNGRKWTRSNEIFNEKGDLSAVVVSNGAFFSRNTRKVITPPKVISKKLFKNETYQEKKDY